MNQDVMTVKEAARRLGICDRIAYEGVMRGDIPARRIGAPGKKGRWVVPVEAFEAWLRETRPTQSAG